MPERPERTPPEKKLPEIGQESVAANEQQTDQHLDTPGATSDTTAQQQAAQKLSEAAWAPEHTQTIRGTPNAAFLIVEGQLVKPQDMVQSWDLGDQQVEEIARQVRQAMERRSFGGLGGPDPDSNQIAHLVEGLRLSDRRAVEMVLNRQEDFRQQLEKLLKDKPGEYNRLIAILDRPDRLDNQPLDSVQAAYYAHKIIDSLKDFSKEGVDSTVNMLSPLSKPEREQIENELSNELKMPFRDWLHRQMPIGHHAIGLNNESITRIEATLDHPDTGTDYKGSIKVLMGGLKDNWSQANENAILHIVSGMNNKEIRDAGLFQELRNSPYLSKTAQQALDVTLAGRDKWTHDKQQARELAETALKAKNLELFKDAMQSSHAREYFRTPEGGKQIDQTFSGPFDSRDKQIAHDYAELNDTKLLTDLKMYQYALSPSKEAITQRLLSASEEERKLFQEGRQLQDLRPKETTREKQANSYYLEVYDALRSACKYDSNQLKDWTQLLLQKETTEQGKEKQDPRQQIIDANGQGITGLDALRNIEETLKTHPELVNALKGTNLTGKDKEFKDAFDATVKRVADDARNSSIGSAIWKELTDINNLNPITQLASMPEHQKQQKDFSQNMLAASHENLEKQLLSGGQLALEQRLFIAGDHKLTATDLLSLKPHEKDRLLKGQYSPKIQEAVFGKGSESEFVRSVLSKQDSQLSGLDQVRAFALGRGATTEQIESLFAGTPAAQRKVLSDQYFEKYKSVMSADVLKQVKDPVDQARVLQNLRHVQDTPEQKLIDAQVEQTKHLGKLDSLSEIYSPDQRLANKYARAAESFYRQVKDGLTDKQKEALDKLPAEKKQEIAEALMKYQSSLKKYWSSQKDYTRNKEEMAEQLADATLTAGAVIASIAQPELSPALLARTAVLSAAGRLGIKQAVMDKDFDTSRASFEKEIFKGSMTGVLNSLGGEAFTSGRFIPLGKFAKVASNSTEKTLSDLTTNQAIKSVLREDAEQILNSKLEQTTMDKVFGSQTKCLNNAKDIAKSIAPRADEKQLEVIAKSIQQHRRQEVLNSLRGKFWHEGDQLTTSVVASVAGASFVEIASTAAGYENPETLIKRLEQSGTAAAAGGALFHFGFKAVGKGIEGMTATIGKDAQGRMYAASGTHVRTAEGKELIVGNEPYYFKNDDTVVEFHKNAKESISAPPFLEAASMPPESSIPIETIDQRKSRQSVSEHTKPVQGDVNAAFDKIPEAERQNFTKLNNNDLDLFHDHYKVAMSVMQDPLEREAVQQRFAFINLIKSVRQREELERQALYSQDTIGKESLLVQDRQPPKPLQKEVIQEELLPDELGQIRKSSKNSPEVIASIAEAFGMRHGDIAHQFGLTTSELIGEAMHFKRSLEQATKPDAKTKFKQLQAINEQVLQGRLSNFQTRHPGIAPARIIDIAGKDAEDLADYRKHTLEPLIKHARNTNVVAYAKQEMALANQLEAEHLARHLDTTRSARISPSTASLREELRIQHQLNISDMRHAISYIIGKPVPEGIRTSLVQKIESDLSRRDGVPKPTGTPVQVTDSLVSIPWKNGEILYSRDGEVTVNDKIAKTSRTINSYGQLIETVSPLGEIRQYHYADNKTNEIKSVSFRSSSAIITFDKKTDGFRKTITHADNSKNYENLPWKKIETNPDGSYSTTEHIGHTTINIDGSHEIHTPGKRTSYYASLTTEEAHLHSNIKDAFKELKEQNYELAQRREFRFNKLLTEFELTSTATNMSEQEKANFYKHINRLLDNNKDCAIKSRAGRREIAEQVLYYATHARQIDQGQNNTCNVTTVEKRCWARHPAAMAQFAADVALDGKFVTTSGHVIDMTVISHGTTPDNESWRSLRLQRQGKLNELIVDGKRSWLSQMTQIAMVNTGWKKLSLLVTPEGVVHPPNIAFDQHSKLLGRLDRNEVTKLYDDQNRLITRWDGVEAVFDEKHNPISVTYDDLVYDSEHNVIGKLDRAKVAPLYFATGKVANAKLAPGDVIYDSPGGREVIRATNYGEIEYGKAEHPIMVVKDRTQLKNLERLSIQTKNLDPSTSKPVKIREYCKSQDGLFISTPKINVGEFMRISSEITGIAEKKPFVVLRAKTKYAYENRVDIVTKEDLSELLKKWQADGNLPGVIYVHAGKPPFSQHFDPKDAAALKHGWHVINAWAIDGDKVDITNQWGKKHNMKISLDELFEAMTDPTGKTGV